MGDDVKSRSNIDKAVDKLIRQGHSNLENLSALRRKYPNDNKAVAEIMGAFQDKMKKIVERARNFKAILIRRYGQTLSIKKIIEKAKKYRSHKSCKMSDDEFDLFIKLIMNDKAYAYALQRIPNTTMSRILGFDQFIIDVGGKLNIDPKEYPTLKSLLDLTGQTKQLHTQIILQHLGYRDCAREALTGKLDYKKDNLYSYIHPLIAALFLPKINYLEEHMLMASIGDIVSKKHEGKAILTKQNVELYWDMITDENDHACSTESPVKDLLNRFILQTKLWDNVLSLRQGRYFHKRLPEFIAAIARCRSSVYDAPESAYVQDEGTTLRKLLAAFSMRPTVVSTSKVWGFSGIYGFGGMNYGNFPSTVSKLTTIPMIQLRLPIDKDYQRAPINLRDGLSMSQWYVEKNTIVPKKQEIIHNRDVAFFYVNRRFKTLNITKFNTPYTFSALPMSVAGWESLNDHVVKFDRIMRIAKKSYKLRSVVFVESATATKKKLIVGCSAGILQYIDGVYDQVAWYYNPQGSGIMFKDVGEGFRQNNPITQIHYTGPDKSFTNMAETQGTIFMYQNVDDGSDAALPNVIDPYN
uniref:Major core protein n=1 Tax=Mimivirus LCMiAC02 TaxID=2506609 RepID=A0A481Z2C9_9VIRU|nr:MAG: major core protein [Mimivirus LCMiAC02]